MYVCICNAVTDRQIRQAVELGARSLDDLKEALGVATGCGKCASCARAILKEELAAPACVPAYFMHALPHGA